MRFALALGALALVATGTVSAPAQPRQITLEAIAIACPDMPDGICLAYAGQMPGPTLVVDLGETVQVTLVNHIAQTLGALPGPASVKDRLASEAISFHVHGTALAPESDGMKPMGGARFADARARAGGSYTYTFRAAHNGTWHYHDHVLGPDGAEGVARGLVGTLIVRGGADVRPDLVVDVHCMDGRCITSPSAPTIPQGGAFEVALVVLGNDLWRIDVAGRSFEMGPGQSEHVVVTSAAGTYAWTATDEITNDIATGQVVAL